MSNTLTAVVPKLLAQGLLALRQMAIMPMLVNRGYETLAGQKGTTIDIPIPSAITVQDVAPGATPPVTAVVAPTSVSITLDQWKEAPFYLTDKELQEVVSGIIPMQASEAIKALANTVDSYIFGLYKGVYGYYGTAGATPFATDTSDATKVRAILDNQLAPLGDRRVVMNADAQANALNLTAFQNTQFATDASDVIAGKLTPKFGFAWFMDQNVPTHTAGTITTGLIAKAATAVAIGATSVVATTAASTGACALKAGDIITFAGSTQTYAVGADVTQAAAATDTAAISITPPLVKALVGSEAITVKATHVVNLAFHRDAFAFANRPLDVPTDGLGAIVQSAIDPVSGLTLRLEITREHKRTRYSYDILYGGLLVRAALAARLAG